MLYHYTSLQAFEGILREAPSDRGLCFWASRYDCFEDHEEYKIGVEEIRNLLPKFEERLQQNRQVASFLGFCGFFFMPFCLLKIIFSLLHIPSFVINNTLKTDFAQNSRWF